MQPRIDLEMIIAAMDRPREDHTKGRKPQRDKHHIISLICGLLKKKKDTNELISKTGTDSQTQKTI